MDTEQPTWFSEAIAHTPERHDTVVAGRRIHYRSWGDPGLAGLVLVHGGAAHSGWWDHVAPLLAEHYYVLAPDLSGHGDSARAASYDMSGWAEEIVGVADAAGLTDPPIVVGHSMGGRASVTACADHPDRFAGLVIIDSPVVDSPPEQDAAQRGQAFGPLRVYPTVADALRRFRTVPHQPESLPYVIAHVALQSIRSADGGWTWKFDPSIFHRTHLDSEALTRVRCRVALLRAQRGLVTPAVGGQMYERLGRVAPVVEIPLAGHHVMLDQPLSLVTSLRTLLADWEHSSPLRTLRPVPAAAPADPPPTPRQPAAGGDEEEATILNFSSRSTS